MQLLCVLKKKKKDASLVKWLLIPCRIFYTCYVFDRKQKRKPLFLFIEKLFIHTLLRPYKLT